LHGPGLGEKKMGGGGEKMEGRASSSRPV
jgi:hypothetical protein